MHIPSVSSISPASSALVLSLVVLRNIGRTGRRLSFSASGASGASGALAASTSVGADALDSSSHNWAHSSCDLKCARKVRVTVTSSVLGWPSTPHARTAGAPRLFTRSGRGRCSGSNATPSVRALLPASTSSSSSQTRSGCARPSPAPSLLLLDGVEPATANALAPPAGVGGLWGDATPGEATAVPRAARPHPSVVRWSYAFSCGAPPAPGCGHARFFSASTAGSCCGSICRAHGAAPLHSARRAATHPPLAPRLRAWPPSRAPPGSASPSPPSPPFPPSPVRRGPPARPAAPPRALWPQQCQNENTSPHRQEASSLLKKESTLQIEGYHRWYCTI